MTILDIYVPRRQNPAQLASTDVKALMSAADGRRFITPGTVHDVQHLRSAKGVSPKVFADTNTSTLKVAFAGPFQVDARNADTRAPALLGDLEESE